MISESIVQATRDASLHMSSQSPAMRRTLLLNLADAIQNHADIIQSANAEDCREAEAKQDAQPLLKRLVCDEAKIDSIVTMLKKLADLDDIIGTSLLTRELDTGLILTQQRCPIGVIAFIFESRPDAFAQMIGLCIKTANALIAKGGREAQRTNSAIFSIVCAVFKERNQPTECFHLLEDREDVHTLLELNGVDMIIPRGSADFVRYIMRHTETPVLGHADGICHVYIDEAADPDMAMRIVLDAKTQYVAVCNAMETLLIHRAVQDILPQIAEELRKHNVEIRGCAKTMEILSDIQPATSKDWDTEYLDYCLSVRIVDSIHDAIDHINQHGSKHSDAIITNNDAAANTFISLVDSASVMRNCSTRFSDGFVYGLGAESGISTGKLHARGPVGLEGLCTYKWIVQGQGHVIKDYSDGIKGFTHKDLGNKGSNNG